MKKVFLLLIVTSLLNLTGCQNVDGGKPEKRENEQKKPGKVALAAHAHENTQYVNPFPQHQPYGMGVGTMPGRVAWTHAPASVSWDGSGYWWQTENFDQAKIQKMVDAGIASLAGQNDVVSGWERLFAAHNAKRSKSSTYQKGEKFAIKVNLNGAGAHSDDTRGLTHEGYANAVLLKALLNSLVNDAGVVAEDITVYDAGRIFPDYMMELCSQGVLKGVKFRYRDPGGPNDALADSSSPVVWSQSVNGATNYLPACVTQATYLINLANLKGHVYGITLGAKNHFGSIINTSRMRAPEAAGIHRYLYNHKMGEYTVLVDLMANYHLGEKTMLTIHDGLIVAPGESVRITKENSTWQQPPFNNHYTASILFSQDPVAIDSVGADLLMNEPTVINNNSAMRDNPAVENYLHEAGLVGNAPSAVTYFNGNGQRVTNLGVHEHWNNAQEKKYSRNLGRAEGIELVYIVF